MNYSNKTKDDLIKEITFLKDELLYKNEKEVAKQKAIELHLKENQEKYKTLFTKNLAGVFITENEEIIECNNSFAKIFGYKSRVELIGKKVNALYFDKKDRNKYIEDLFYKKILTNYKVKHKNKNGEELWILTNVFIDKKGRIEGTIIDITEQIKTEKRLKESQENYKKLIDNSPYGTIIHIDGEIVYANPKALHLFGFKSFKQLKEKKNIFNFLPKKYQKEGLERRKRILSGEDVPFVEVTIKNPLTKKNMVLESKATKYDYNGKEAIQLFIKDVTLEKDLLKEKLRTKIAEESNKILHKEVAERKKIEIQLIENQKYTKSIIDSSLDIICASDKSGSIIEFNAAAEKAFGYYVSELKNKSIRFVYASEKESLKVGEQLKKTGSFIGEVKNKRKNGEVFTSFLTASVLYNDKGEQIGTMGVSRDITELKEAELQLIESEEKYRDLFENATDLIQSVDVKGNIIYVNKAWKKATGFFDVENKSIFEMIYPGSIDHCKSLFQEIAKSKENEIKRISFDLKTKEGKKISVEGNVSLKFKDGKPESTRSILRDVTEELWENKKQEVHNNIAKIVTQKSNPEEIYEGIRIELGKIFNTDIFVISYLLNKETITFPYYYDKIKGNGRVYKKDRSKGEGINEYFLKQKTSKLLKRKELNGIINVGGYELLGQKCKVFVGVPLIIKNKTVGVISVQSYNNENEYNNKTLEVLDFISGELALIIQRKQDEIIIAEQSSKIKSIIENSTHLFWTYDKDKGVTSSNNNFVKYIKEAYNRDAEIKKESNKKVRFSDDDQHSFWDKKYEETFKGKSQYFISKKHNINGEEIVKEVFLNPIYNNKGKVVEVSGIAHDITEKTQSEKELKESLKEKEILLKEVHHRVKNNLQVISSILNLQSSYVKDEKTLDILRESQNRIKSMSFIHESLYQNTDFSEINFSEYIVSLSKNLVHSYGIYDNFIELDFAVGNISLNLDLSIPCGLIINELVSNALKYAFLGKESGVIKIELFEKNGNVHLIVQDNGLGLPKKINYKETDSLGLQLVTTLVEQISGKIELENKKGAKFTIIFKKDQ